MQDDKHISSNPPIIGKATVVEMLDRRTIRVSLPNGKLIHAHVPKKVRIVPEFVLGDQIEVRMNPYDFSRARIIVDDKSTKAQKDT